RRNEIAADNTVLYPPIRFVSSGIVRKLPPACPPVRFLLSLLRSRRGRCCVAPARCSRSMEDRGTAQRDHDSFASCALFPGDRVVSSNNRKWLRSPSERVGTLSHADLPPPALGSTPDNEEHLLI